MHTTEIIKVLLSPPSFFLRLVSSGRKKSHRTTADVGLISEQENHSSLVKSGCSGLCAVLTPGLPWLCLDLALADPVMTVA